MFGEMLFAFDHLPNISSNNLIIFTSTCSLLYPYDGAIGHVEMLGEMFGAFDHPRSNLEEFFASFPTSMFDEVFGTFDHGALRTSSI